MKGEKGKAPAFQFYVKDWLSDPQLRLASPSTRGIWIDLLCFMWEAPERGILEISKKGLAKLTGASNGDIELFFQEAKELLFCDIFVTCNGLSQICNRRMSREYKSKENNRLRQQKHRSNKASNGSVTSPKGGSPTPTPSPTAVTSRSAGTFEFIDPKLLKRVGTKWPKCYQWIQKSLKHNKNESAIIHVLKRIDGMKSIHDYYAFATKVLNVESGNYNEQEFRTQEAQRQKKELKQHIDSIGEKI